MPDDHLANLFPGGKPSLHEGDPAELFTLAQASELVGLTRHTLRTYNSHRRCGRFRGPRPTKLPGTTSVFYTREDLRRYLREGFTGATDGGRG